MLNDNEIIIYTGKTEKKRIFIKILFVLIINMYLLRDLSSFEIAPIDIRKAVTYVLVIYAWLPCFFILMHYIASACEKIILTNQRIIRKRPWENKSFWIKDIQSFKDKTYHKNSPFEFTKVKFICIQKYQRGNARGTYKFKVPNIVKGNELISKLNEVISELEQIATICLKEKEKVDKIRLRQSAAYYYVQKAYFWDSEIEMDFYPKLRDIVRKEYSIIPHVSFRELFKVVDWSKDANRQFSYLATYHIDFLICYPNFFQPILAVEVQGAQHFNDENQILRDVFKKACLEKSGIPLLEILPTEINDEEAVREKMKQIKDIPIYCNCEKRGVKMIKRGAAVESYGDYFKCLKCNRNVNVKYVRSIYDLLE